MIEEDKCFIGVHTVFNNNIYKGKLINGAMINGKRVIVFSLLSLIFLSLLTGFVSAADISKTIQTGLDDFAAVATPIAAFLVGGFGSALTGEELLGKFLVFALVLTIVTLSARQIPLVGDRKGIAFLVALIISMLGVRYITTKEILETVWLPNSVLALTIASLFPFIIFFFFIEGFDSSGIRKIGWTTYLVIFAFLGGTRWDALKITSGPFSGYNAAWIYLIIAVISGLLLIFDKNIRVMFRMREVGKITDRKRRIQAVKVSDEISELYGLLAKATTPADRKAIETDIKAKEAILKTLFT